MRTKETGNDILQLASLEISLGVYHVYWDLIGVFELLAKSQSTFVESGLIDTLS